MTWALAGTKAAEDQPDSTSSRDVFTIEGEPYLVSGGYHIPYYQSIPDGDEETVVREKLAIDLTKRFFRNAELGINVRFSHKDIVELRDKYDHLPEGSEEKRAAGALLVGAIMNRIERLSHAVLQNKALMRHKVDNQQIATSLTEAIAPHDPVDPAFIHQVVSETIDYSRTLFSSVTIDQALERDHRDLPADEKFSTYEREIKGYYEDLVKHQELVRCVRRRDRSTDRQGILYDMIRDAGKAWKVPLDAIYFNRVQKIGQAMHDIDRTADLLLTFIQQPPYENAPSLPDDIRLFADLAKKRTGVKTDIAGPYTEVEIAFKVAEAKLFNFLKQEIRRAQGASTMTEGFELIRRGIRLIDDMAEIRQSRNIWEIDKPEIINPEMADDEKSYMQRQIKAPIDRLEHDMNQFSQRRISPMQALSR